MDQIFLDQDDLDTLYKASKKEAQIWREDYPNYERLADNGLLEGLDDNLPEVNDGSLAAALFKLPKRIVSSKLAGYAKSIDRDEAWVTELANLVWTNEIIPNANTQAPFHRKWKDAVRKSAIYGSVPIISMFVTRGKYTGADFIVAQPQDVTLEPGKVSDYDSDVIFWDIYYTKSQLKNMISQAKSEVKDNEATEDATTEAYDSGSDDDDTYVKPEPYNKWNIEALEKILEDNNTQQRSSIDSPRQDNINGAVKPEGFKFCIAFQRGVDAPFYMYSPDTQVVVREWTNPDPTGDVPVHFLYCYQDFINPYGIGIVKLAGGTQNVLDYMRQADVLATQIGINPPILIEGDPDEIDEESITYSKDALWFAGNAKLTRQEMSSGVYTELPNRIAMYKTSLQALIPTGDTSIGSAAGDPQMSKTPQGVQFQANNLSIDDEDYQDNLFITYEAVARSMINIHFANMEGSDIMRLSDDEKANLYKVDPVQFAPFMAQPDPTTGQTPPTTNQLEVIWDTVRSKFSFEIDPSTAIDSNDADQANTLTEIVKAITPQTTWQLGQDGWKYDAGQAWYSLLTKSNVENIDEILTKMTDEEAAEAKQQPFPIIDPPQIRLTGAIPEGAMPAALASGGVNIDPASIQQQPATADLDTIYKDPTTGDSVKEQIQQKAGLIPQVVTAPSDTLNAVKAVQDASQAKQQASIAQQQADTAAQTAVSQPVQTPQPVQTAPATTMSKNPDAEEMSTNVAEVMKQYGVNEHTALTALAAEHAGYPIEDIIAKLKDYAKGAK